MKHYKGFRGTNNIAQVVTNDGYLNPRYDLFNHSPDGYEWGYGGSGPAQLALALLADALGKDDMAVTLHQHFKRMIVQNFPHEGFEISEDHILGWVAGFCTAKVVFAPDPTKVSRN